MKGELFMRVYNSMSRTKEELVPVHGKKINMYACGITVYDQCHIGHARQAITYDVISSYLRYRGYDVTYVRNYTDVDDKIIARANEQGVNALDYSRQKIKEAEEDLGRLRIRDADITPKASENIQNIISFIEGLIEKGHAYATDRGDVYFSVDTFPEYGKLSGRNTEELLNGVRKDVEEGKRDPKDFALWKSAKEGEIYWETPWGKGRPGWHIECSAMALNNLGEMIDIHGGGKDLIFPHHENEIAQSEALTGKRFAKYWIHNGLITVNGQKMSKSLGNSMTIREALDKYHHEVIRLLMLSKHYSTELDLNEREFAIAEKQVYYFYNTLNRIDCFVSGKQPLCALSVDSEIEENFIGAMDDDFNTSAAVSHIYAVCKNINAVLDDKKPDEQEKINRLSVIKYSLVKVYGVIGLLQDNPSEVIAELRDKHLKDAGITGEQIEALISQRLCAKKNKDYAIADRIRKELDDKGILLNDSRDGTSWDIKDLYSVSGQA